MKFFVIFAILAIVGAVFASPVPGSDIDINHSAIPEGFRGIGHFFEALLGALAGQSYGKKDSPRLRRGHKRGKN